MYKKCIIISLYIFSSFQILLFFIVLMGELKPCRKKSVFSKGRGALPPSPVQASMILWQYRGTRPKCQPTSQGTAKSISVVWCGGVDIKEKHSWAPENACRLSRVPLYSYPSFFAVYYKYFDILFNISVTTSNCFQILYAKSHEFYKIICKKLLN